MLLYCSVNAQARVRVCLHIVERYSGFKGPTTTYRILIEEKRLMCVYCMLNINLGRSELKDFKRKE
jgi:hypothetical protein